MKGPTMRPPPNGRMRLTSKPPRSRLRLPMTCAIALISPLSGHPLPCPLPSREREPWVFFWRQSLSRNPVSKSPSPLAGEGRGEGERCHLPFYFLHHPCDIRKHVVIPESNHAKSAGFQPASPLRVRLLLTRVVAPIKLDD